MGRAAFTQVGVLKASLKPVMAEQKLGAQVAREPSAAVQLRSMG